jgi:DNA processing protein
VSVPIHTVTPTSPAYPERLGQVSDRPATLDVLGQLAEREVAVAIVGARAASGLALDQARSLACDLGLRGAIIISGGAIGVDTAAHRGALNAGAPTISVFGTGLDVAYPARNRPLFDDIVERGGALVSCFERNAPPRRGQFVRRNRVIAALADAVVVIGAGAGSGALYTAKAARDYGRVLGAAPGSLGCEALIAGGAALVETADDVFAALAGSPRRPEVWLPESGTDEARVLAALDAAPRDEDGIADDTGLEMRAVSRALTGLELEGLAVVLPGRNYIRSTLASELLLQ